MVGWDGMGWGYLEHSGARWLEVRQQKELAKLRLSVGDKRVLAGLQG